MKQKYLIIAVAAIVILGGLYLYMRNHKAAAPENTNQTSSTNSNTNEFTGDVPNDKPDNSGQPTSATVAVSEQTPGSSITIDNAFLEKPGFIAIHEVDSKGQPGKIIGASGYLTVGPKQDLEINVPIVAGGKYIAMLHEDNGDKKFNAATDMPVKSNNIPIMTMFSVSQ